jgi:hypothetical protein
VAEQRERLQVGQVERAALPQRVQDVGVELDIDVTEVAGVKPV